jgi:hypothetical protein
VYRLLITLILLLLAGTASACSCYFPEGSLRELVTQAYGQASAVLVARAESVEDVGLPRTRQRTRFVAIESWKGKHGDRFITDIEVMCCVCGYSFMEGREYLLYLYGPDEDGSYKTNTCSRTRPVTPELAVEIEVLRSMVKGL